MLPGARIAAAMALLDEILAGAPAEKVLTAWARKSRFAGSGDRRAVRDHVFDALRHRRSYGALGGADTGRGLMLGALVAAGEDPALLCTGTGHAPLPPAPGELPALVPSELPEPVALDVPDWLMARLRATLGAHLAPAMRRQQVRAPVFLRVNTARLTRDEARAALLRDGIETTPHPLAETALEAVKNERKIKASRAYLDGLVELQDAASQAVCAHIPEAGRALDYCAGGGGKALALAARGIALTAHDADPARMRDLPARAARAGVGIAMSSRSEVQDAAPWELVVADVPCSGSGTWARNPQTKWALTPERLAELTRLQADILDETALLVAPHGTLAYITCALLAEENEDQIVSFLARHEGWRQAFSRRISPLEGGDGLFISLLTR